MIIIKIILANSIKSAELAKLVENAQRDINISFMNEIYKICDVYNLDYKHVLNLCSTKWNLWCNMGLISGAKGNIKEKTFILAPHYIDVVSGTFKWL